jgi:hypothetical protein
VNFTGSNIFHGNNGSSLKVVSTIIHLSGELQFINNSGGKESALYMQSFSQVVLHRGLSIIFEGNSGRFGASILVESITTSTVYSQLAGNPQCPFLYEDPDLSPLNWTNVSVKQGMLYLLIHICVCIHNTLHAVQLNVYVTACICFMLEHA